MQKLERELMDKTAACNQFEQDLRNAQAALDAKNQELANLRSKFDQAGKDNSLKSGISKKLEQQILDLTKELA